MRKTTVMQIIQQYVNKKIYGALQLVFEIFCFLLNLSSDFNSPEGQGFCQAGFSADFVKVQVVKTP